MNRDLKAIIDMDLNKNQIDILRKILIKGIPNADLFKYRMSEIDPNTPQPALHSLTDGDIQLVINHQCDQFIGMCVDLPNHKPKYYELIEIKSPFEE